MNIFDCKLIDRRGVRAIGASCFAPQSPPNIMKMLKGLEDGTEIKLGVRPEDIEISKTKTSQLTCEADIRLLEPLGDSLIVTLKIGDTVMKAKTKPGFKADIGEHIYVTFDWNRTNLFLARTEQSLIP
jgi:ABC-type sugar transport system ATPase subunit